MSLDVFRDLDIFIGMFGRHFSEHHPILTLHVPGVASFIPLFLYTFTLYLLTAKEFVPSLPVSYQNIAKYVLLAFIPLIIAMNELSSFIGITYRKPASTVCGTQTKVVEF